MSPEITPIAALKLERKLELLDELWGVIAQDPELNDVPQWHLEVLAERTAELDRDPQAVVAWEDLKKELTARLP